MLVQGLNPGLRVQHRRRNKLRTGFGGVLWSSYRFKCGTPKDHFYKKIGQASIVGLRLSVKPGCSNPTSLVQQGQGLAHETTANDC